MLILPRLGIGPSRFSKNKRFGDAVECHLMQVQKLSEVDIEEVGGDVQESTALKKEGLVGDVGDQVVTANEVTFRPGKRTNMHKHTHGQLLYVTGGRGVVGTEDEQYTVERGDLVFFHPGEVHWHGTSREDPAEFSHLTVVLRDGVGEGTIAVGDDESR